MTCPMRELAATSVLGCLSPAERSQLDVHLSDGCQECEQELRAVGELAVGLATAVAAEPPATLRAKLLAGVCPPGVLHDQAGILIKRPDDQPWKRFIPGIDRKILHTDPERRYRSYLLRFEPGAKLFKHSHPEVEEILVVSGDVHISGLHMREGDYCRASAESVHEEAWSDNGCVIFVVSSMDNQVVT